MATELDSYIVHEIGGNCPNCGYPVLVWFKVKLLEMAGQRMVVKHCMAGVDKWHPESPPVKHTCKCFHKPLPQQSFPFEPGTLEPI